MQLEAFAIVNVSEHAFALHTNPPVTHPQELPAPSVVALQRAKLSKEYDEQGLASRHWVPLNAQVLIYDEQVAAEGLGTASVHPLALHLP